MFGRDPRLIVDILWVTDDQTPHGTPQTYVEEMMQRRERAARLVTRNVEIAAQKMKERYDGTHKAVEYHVGQQVRLRRKKSEIPHTPDQQPKLAKRNKGPYTIIRRLDDLTYELREDTTGKSIGIHNVKKLKLHTPHVPTTGQPHVIRPGLTKTKSVNGRRQVGPQDGRRKAAREAKEARLRGQPIPATVQTPPDPQIPPALQPPPVQQPTQQPDVEYEVDKIIDKRKGTVEPEYLVTWKGYDDREWIALSGLQGAQDEVEGYERVCRKRKINKKRKKEE